MSKNTVSETQDQDYIYIINGAWGGGRWLVGGRWFSGRRQQGLNIVIFTYRVCEDPMYALL